MSKTIVIISDTQLPYEDQRALGAVVRFIGEFQPDEVVHIGDLMDYPQPARFSKGTAAEFQGSVYEDSDYAKRKLLAPLRAVYDGPLGVIEGNHDLRPRTYLAKYAPALAGTGAFDMAHLLSFDDFGITHLPDFYEFAPEWLMTHGHLGGIRLTQDAGKTALNAATRFQSSVIMGHTHRLGITHKTNGYDSKLKTVTGFEVGNLMNMKLAQYLKRATANWQQGFGVVRVNGNHVHPEAVGINDNRFTVDGVQYAV